MDDWRARRPVRASHLEIEEAADGFIVYQPDRDRIHYLNQTAALLLEMAEGDMTGEEMALTVARAFNLATPPWDDVAEGLGELAAEGLLVGPADGTAA